MKKRVFATAAVVLMSTTAILVLLWALGRASSSASGPALAAPLHPDQTVTEVAPSSAPNDLDSVIVITGTDFDAGATVLLGDTSLQDVAWVSGTSLRAAVPWGMDPVTVFLRLVLSS